MSQETFLFIIQMLAITLVVVPWWLYRKARGLSFDDGTPPEGQPDAFYWWAVTALWLLSAGVAFLLGGWRGVFLFLGAMAGLALLWASVWTPIQSRRRRNLLTAASPAPLLPFRQRFLANFRSALIELPARLVDGI